MPEEDQPRVVAKRPALAPAGAGTCGGRTRPGPMQDRPDITTQSVAMSRRRPRGQRRNVNFASPETSVPPTARRTRHCAASCVRGRGRSIRRCGSSRSAAERAAASRTAVSHAADQVFASTVFDVLDAAVGQQRVGGSGRVRLSYRTPALTVADVERAIEPERGAAPQLDVVHEGDRSGRCESRARTSSLNPSVS